VNTFPEEEEQGLKEGLSRLTEQEELPEDSSEAGLRGVEEASSLCGAFPWRRLQEAGTLRGLRGAGQAQRVVVASEVQHLERTAPSLSSPCITASLLVVGGAGGQLGAVPGALH